MNFKYYDLLSHLIPGLVIYIIISNVFKESIPDVSTIPLLSIAFIIGYFNNTIASWLEGFYHFLLGGNPVNRFFDANGIWKVRYYSGNKLKSLIKRRIDNDDPDNVKLFVEAMKIANLKSTQRLEDFNAIYAFSRGILTAIIISGGIVLYSDHTNIYYYLIVGILVLIALIRNRQRNGYYIKEVLNITENELNKSENAEN